MAGILPSETAGKSPAAALARDMQSTLTSTGGRARLEKNKKKASRLEAIRPRTCAGRYDDQGRGDSDQSSPDHPGLPRASTCPIRLQRNGWSVPTLPQARRQLPAQAVFTIIARVKRLAWQSRIVAYLMFKDDSLSCPVHSDGPDDPESIPAIRPKKPIPAILPSPSNPQRHPPAVYKKAPFLPSCLPHRNPIPAFLPSL